jgi:thiol:disulfide interchange protein DsbD
MKSAHYFFFITVLFIGFSTSAQVLKPAKWNFKASKVNPQVGETINIIFTATIDKEWYMYSSRLKVDGPMPTEARFTNNGSFETVGDLIPIKPKEKYDEIWEGKVNYFTEKAIFVQKVKVLKSNPTIEGLLSYQTCTIKDGSCVPNKDKFKLSL